MDVRLAIFAACFLMRSTANGVEYGRLVLQHGGAEGAIQAHARCAAFGQR